MTRQVRKKHSVAIPVDMPAMRKWPPFRLQYLNHTLPEFLPDPALTD